ncbi:hypothetical protein T265_04601 [Opisthorchis viverrini]|uniref:Uncharacterized protein n=1 Tax=Opisthorchis viverrini TaxID=6198 RepID=A0A074ZMD6_OPIVI|nr:hypothetical protein T265_04601 [Opisthorchis viverrini]KER28553.1 hypothetical protein T265_04601 [Opisthorchis viverrini]
MQCQNLVPTSRPDSLQQPKKTDILDSLSKRLSEQEDIQNRHQERHRNPGAKHGSGVTTTSN